MKFSITIPAYKATYFEECIASVLNQTYSDYEIIILNDCSPEGLKDIVNSFSSHPNFIKIRYYENEKNVGAIDVVDNWNKLLHLAKGEFVICMGDDDKLASDCLEQYNTLMDKYPNLDIYHARTYIINEQSELIDIQEARPDWESSYSIVWHMFRGHRRQYIGDYLFRREKLIEEGGFYPLPMARGSDWITGIICSKEKGIANGQKPTFYYRESSRTITSATDGEVLVDADIKLRKWILNYLEAKPNDDLEQEYRKILLPIIPDNLNTVLVKNIARDIGFSSVRKWFYWKGKRSKYGISTKQFHKITFFSFLYFLKRITGISSIF